MSSWVTTHDSLGLLNPRFTHYSNMNLLHPREKAPGFFPWTLSCNWLKRRMNRGLGELKKMLCLCHWRKISISLVEFGEHSCYRRVCSHSRFLLLLHFNHKCVSVFICVSEAPDKDSYSHKSLHFFFWNYLLKETMKRVTFFTSEK